MSECGDYDSECLNCGCVYLSFSSDYISFCSEECVNIYADYLKGNANSSEPGVNTDAGPAP